jgi:uncharacterized protein YggE
MRRIALLLMAAFCPIAFAQLDSNSITVAASNNVTLQPDQVVFSVSVTASQSTGLDEILAALQGSGITIANFVGVSTSPQVIAVIGPAPPAAPAPMLTWIFSLPAPLANTKATITSLTTLQQNIAKANTGLTLSFSIVGTQVSQQLAQAQTCSFPGLIASATTQAQALAAAGGVTLGSILAISSATATIVPANFVSFNGIATNVYASATPPPCGITVKFTVTRN